MTDPKPAPRRVALTPESITEAAFGVIEDEGLQAFSMRKLATRLGCEAMSLYHYFPSKAHLMDALVDQAMGELASPPPDRPFGEQIRVMARSWRAMGLRHPAFFPFVALHRLNTPRALAWLNATLGLFRSAGFPDREAAYHFRVLGYYLAGAILDETNGYAKGPSSVQVVTEEDLVRDFPDVSAVGRWFRPENWEAIFERGLDIVLAGIEGARKDLTSER
jgi:AcrR family transcriptional regulator